MGKQVYCIQNSDAGCAISVDKNSLYTVSEKNYSPEIPYLQALQVTSPEKPSGQWFQKIVT